MKKKIFIFQQREWHNRIGKYLAKKLLDDNYSLACLTFKKNVNQRINEQYKDYYENIISHDDIIENPKKYINKKNENLSLQEISKNLCDCDLWQIIQSARNHVKSYKKKFYYSFSQNKDDKEIINYLRALYCTAEYVYENFKPDIIFTPNFVSLPHIVFNLYFKKKNIPMFGTADCKVAAKDIFIYDYCSKVLRSPSSWPRALALRTRRMILPERVLGNTSTNSTASGMAILPISLPTWAFNDCASLMSPLRPSLRIT